MWLVGSVWFPRPHEALHLCIETNKTFEPLKCLSPVQEPSSSVKVPQCIKTQTSNKKWLPPPSDSQAYCSLLEVFGGKLGPPPRHSEGANLCFKVIICHYKAMVVLEKMP